MIHSDTAQILINCDMGESFGPWQMGNDEQVMPYVDMANIACGYHAGDPQVMAKTVELANSKSKKIGAHPGYPDKQGFGRRSMTLTADEIKHFLWYQVGALGGIAEAMGVKLFHVKPHGALYNDMMRDEAILSAVMQSVAAFDKELKLVIQATPNGKKHAQLAQKIGVELLFEAFSDRGYQSNGLLIPRGQAGALLDAEQAIAQSKSVLNEGTIASIEGLPITLQVDTLCIHGDGVHALKIAQALR